MAMTGSGMPGEFTGAAGGQGGRSHLAAGAKVTGDLAVPGLIELVCRVEGRVTADSVVIEQQGSVEGEIEAGGVAIRGAFDGRISAGAVRLHATARVSGTILYRTLAIESGAEVTATFHRVPPAEAPAGP